MSTLIGSIRKVYAKLKEKNSSEDFELSDSAKIALKDARNTSESDYVDL